MKNFSILCFLAATSFFCPAAFSQPFNTVWKYALGGSNVDDIGSSIAATADGGSVAVGWTLSDNNGDVGDNHGGFDGWIVKQDVNGNILWQKPLGGSDFDYLTDVAVDPNGFIYAVGYARSYNGDVHGNHAGGGYDLWIVKLNADGDTLRTKCYGGSGDDIGFSVTAAADGNIFVCGRGMSNDGDLTGCEINSLWIMKLNGSLNKIWSKCFGAGAVGLGFYNSLFDVHAMADGGCITTGDSYNYTEIDGAHGDADAWVIKFDGSGTILWERALGGSKTDLGRSVIPTSDGGYLVSIECRSDDGDGEGHHGDVGSAFSNDVLLVKLDANGNTFWEHSFGSDAREFIGEVIETPDHNFLSINSTQASPSDTGDVEGTNGYINGWIFKVDPLGHLLWQKVVLSADPNGFYLNAGTVTQDNAYVLTGYTADPTVPGYHGNGYYDFYTSKIKEPEGPSLPIAPWTATLGGSDAEIVFDAEPTSDGGVIATGISGSIDGDVTGNYGLSDYWLVKLDPHGTLQWQNNFGWGGIDYAYTTEQTNDGGYVIGGWSQGYNVLKLDASNNIEWNNIYGQEGYTERAQSIRQTPDGNFIVAGLGHFGYDSLGFHQGYDFRVVKLDGSGNKLWERYYGGSRGDFAYSIDLTLDNGYIIAGGTGSFDGDVTGYHGTTGSDAWVIKIDGNGNLQWQKALGGTKHDQANWVRHTSDGGYIVACETTSNNGDVSGNHGGSDFWIVKLNAGGGIVWKKTFGGSGDDAAHSICQTNDGNFVAVGETVSNNGNVSGNHGQSDYWIIQLDPNGNLLWQKCFGGTNIDIAYSVSVATDGDVIVGGGAISTDGDVTGHHGTAFNNDFWILKFSPGCNSVFYPDLDGDGYGSNTSTVTGCFPPAGYVFNNLDCNDGDGSVHPGNALDICNGLDDDCDGVVDENGTYVHYFQDGDGDGYGQQLNNLWACSPPAGYVTNNLDCNDANASAHPGACEIYSNGVDEDCNGVADDCIAPSSGFATSNITATTAKVKWNTLPCAVGYTVQYRKTGTTSWTQVNVAGNTGSKKLMGLQSQTNYEWQVRTKCHAMPNIFSSYSAIQTFTTGSLREASDLTFTNLKLIPNPADHFVTVTCNDCEGVSEISFYNVLGQNMLKKKIDAIEGSLNESIDVSGLPPGTYVVEIKSADRTSTIKMIRQ